MKFKDIKKGEVIAATYDKSTQEPIFILNNGIETVYVKAQEMIIQLKNPMDYIGLHLQYHVTEIKNERQYASTLLNDQQSQPFLYPDQLEALQHQFQEEADKIYQAVVVYKAQDSVMVTVNGCLARLLNSSFSIDPIRVTDCVEIGDVVAIKIKYLSKHFTLVELATYYTSDQVLKPDDLVEGALVFGIVNGKRTIKIQTPETQEQHNHIFTRLASGVDALSPINYYQKCEPGLPVVFKINQLNADGRIRGKVLKTLPLHYAKGNLHSEETKHSLHVGDVVTAQIKMYYHDAELNDHVFILVKNHQKIKVPGSELSAIDLSLPIIQWIGRQITVEIIQDGYELIASKVKSDQNRREKLITHWRENPSLIKAARIKEIGNVGYIVEVSQEEAYMLKSDANTPLTVNAQIYVELKSTVDNLIYVRPYANQKDSEKEAAFKRQIEQDPYQTFDATIIKMTQGGAYVSVEGFVVFLANTAYTIDKSRVMDYHEINDIIQVRLKVNRYNQIIAKALYRQKSYKGLQFKELELGMLAHGVIRSIHPSNMVGQYLVFISVGGFLEVLTAMPEYFSVQEGDEVVCRIKQITEGETPRIRGKIMRNLSTPKTTY